jgi:hypothetical protein
MDPSRIVAALALAGGLAASTPLHAQSEQCDSCVALSPVAELSTSVAPIVPSRLQSVLRSSDGRFLVSHLFVDPQIAVYDSTGEFFRLYNATGGGPGEFDFSPSLFDAPGSDIWALEQNRLVRFDATLRHLETRNLGVQYLLSNLLVLSDSTLVLSARTSSPGDSVYAVRLTDADWSGSRTLERSPDRYGLALIAPAASGGFWTLGTNQLVLRKYDGLGELSRSVELTSPHFEPWQGAATTDGLEGFDAPPRPRHKLLYDAGRGRIVIMTRVAAQDWQPTPSDRMFKPSEVDENAKYDTIAAIVDVASGRTLSTTRFDAFLSSVDGAPDLVYVTRVDAVGHVVTTIYRIRVP